MDNRVPSQLMLSSSVIAVPPLARDKQGKIDRVENERIVRHLEKGAFERCSMVAMRSYIIFDPVNMHLCCNVFTTSPVQIRRWFPRSARPTA